MATKKVDDVVIKPIATTYKGSQLLKLDKYNNRVARILIKPNESYSLDEVDALIENFMKKKG